MASIDENIQGNLSTIILFVYMIFAPTLQSFNITQSMFSELILAIVGIILFLWSAYNPNSLKILGNEKKECGCCGDQGNCNCSEDEGY